MIETLLLGTYTKKNSEGIYRAELDTEKKQLQNLQLVAKESNPTYLTKSSDGTLYAVYDQERMGGVAAFKPEEDGTFTLINKVLETGAPVCYVAFDEDRQLIYGANYHKGELNTYTVTEEKGVGPATSYYHHDKTGPHPNQDAPHIHFTNQTPDGRLIVCDLGTDQVYVYDVEDKGLISTRSIYKAQPATGPRHLVFNPNGKYVYLVGELDSSVSVLEYHESGDLVFVEKYSTKPDDWTDFNSAAAIRFNEKTNTLYVSNRGHDSIAVFQVSEDGRELELIQRIKTEGHFPRDFNIDPTGQFIVVGHQFSDNLTLFEIDQTNGKLTLLDDTFYGPETVCVYFE
ncbi:6-phosphogluconolactonase [Weissella uvarum]|uniref:lactonase family protein n=1 Tax=Weissella uvarum TaxID=1479233 RepID=UPI00195FA00A|nr:lactonase family protein [Weissella uvarum]MBM7617677.1 6-phosphogluconolactonase [Weissella uvarum]MCM0596026.1 lactonase family protein [Weissella uvarum]